MSLFPAYATNANNVLPSGDGGVSSDSAGEGPGSGSVVSPGRECQLLASDSEPEEVRRSPLVPQPAPSDYYVDQKWDCGNLRVSTLYHPARPLYDVTKRWSAGGRAERRKRRVKRYFDAAEARAADTDASAALADEVAARGAALRRALATRPEDEDSWLRLIELQERWRDADAALATARDAAAALPRSRRVRSALLAARAVALPPHERAAALRCDLAAAGPGPQRAELWLRLLEASAAAGGTGALDAAAESASAATRDFPPVYPHLLYVYGALLRAAGLWERLALLVELALAMNFPAVPSAPFPPPALDAPERRAADEARLRDAEDKAAGSGLPLGTVWARVERLRAAAHWRAAAGPGDAAGDPQRLPAAADVGALLRPAASPDAAFLLLVSALRLAQVPALPAAEYAARAGPAAALRDASSLGAGAAELPAMLRAARRLPPAHPSRPSRAEARALLARMLDPPHCFDDAHGYLSWVRALWDASLEWTAGERRLALLCWRLRWLHALALLLDPQEESGRAEARRIRGEARDALRKHAGGSALPFAHWARLQRALGASPAEARATAERALRAALRDASSSPLVRLYVARVASELSDASDEARAAGAWARACAAVGRELPPEAELRRPPPPELLRAAALRCEERCESIESELRESEAEVEAEAEEWGGAACREAMLPGEGEWAAARAALGDAASRGRLLEAMRGLPPAADLPPRAARYWEHCAAALAAHLAPAARVSRLLAHKFPHNALLALGSAGAPAWAWPRDASQRERALALAPPRAAPAALALALPALLAAAQPRAGKFAAAAAARTGARTGTRTSRTETLPGRGGRGGAGAARGAGVRARRPRLRGGPPGRGGAPAGRAPAAGAVRRAAGPAASQVDVRARRGRGRRRGGAGRRAAGPPDAAARLAGRVDASRPARLGRAINAPPPVAETPFVSRPYSSIVLDVAKALPVRSDITSRIVQPILTASDGNPPFRKIKTYLRYCFETILNFIF